MQERKENGPAVAAGGLPSADPESTPLTDPDFFNDVLKRMEQQTACLHAAHLVLDRTERLIACAGDPTSLRLRLMELANDIANAEVGQ